MKEYFVIAIAILGLILMGSAAQAQPCNFNVSSGNWTDGGNWSCGHEPTFADQAVILSGNTCTMDDAAGEADSLTVESTATLNIATGNTLSLNSSTTNSTITGTVNLQGSGAELAFIDNSQTIDGAGKIVGQHNLAEISITAGEELTSDTTIEGKLTIVGDGKFVNFGTVHANVSGILRIACDDFDDDSGGVWKISTTPSAVLEIEIIDTGIPLLEGDWTIENNGTLDVDSFGFQTSGSLSWKGGTIDVADGCIADFGQRP